MNDGMRERIKLTDKINHVVNSYPRPMTETALNKRGLPKQDFFFWMIARICKLENDVERLESERKFNLSLIKTLGNKKKAAESVLSDPMAPIELCSD